MHICFTALPIRLSDSYSCCLFRCRVWGANTARMIMSSYSAAEIQEMKATGNVTALNAIKGIGAKTAQRIIVDLKDKIMKVAGMENNDLQLFASTASPVKDEAVSALVMLGFAANASQKVIDSILKKEPTLKVGNLSAKRDFTDVRDVVRAYSLLMQKGKSGEIYNVGSGKAISIRSILDIIISISKLNIDVIVDKEKLRPVDVPIIEADITKIQSETGWAPTIEIEKTIIENLEYWRQNI